MRPAPEFPGDGGHGYPAGGIGMGNWAMAYAIGMNQQSETVTNKTTPASRPWVAGCIKDGVEDSTEYTNGHSAARHFRNMILYDLDDPNSTLPDEDYMELFKLAAWITQPAAAGTDGAKFITERECVVGSTTYFLRMVKHDDVA